MATITHTKKYKCHDDCHQSGCPTHEAKLEVQTCSDAYTFHNGKGRVYSFERGELSAFIDLLKGLDRCDVIQI